MTKQQREELERAAAQQHSQIVCRGAYAHGIVRERVEQAFIAGARWALQLADNDNDDDALGKGD